MQVFGDSISVGVGASTPSKSWVGLYSPVNSAVSGYQAGDMSNQLASTLTDDNYALAIGTNDVRIYKDNATKKGYFESFLRHCLAWLAYPNRVRARDMTITGAWSNTSVNSFGRYSLVNGATIKATVTGAKIFVGYIIQNALGAVSTADVYIDGVIVGSISCDGYTVAMNTQNGATYANACKVFNVAYGEHLVEIVNTSVNGKYLYVNYVACEQSSPAIKVSNIIKMSASAYAALGISQATTDAYNAIINNVLQDFSTVLVDNYSVIDPSIHLTSDGVHPNDLGHSVIHTSFVN